MTFPIEYVLISAGTILLFTVLLRRRFLKQRLENARESLFETKFDSLVPSQALDLMSKTREIIGDGSFSFRAQGSIQYEGNFDYLALTKRWFIGEIRESKVLLIAEPGNFERKLAVAVTVDGKILGYLPEKIANQMHKFLLTDSSAIMANAKIYIGTQSRFHEVWLDLAQPLRIKRFSKRAT